MPSKVIKLIFNNEKPQLEIFEPTDGAQIKGGDKKVKVVGKTENLNSVSVNGLTVIVNNDGGFTIEVPLNDGDNTISIVVTNNVGNSTQIEKKVTYTP